MELCRIKKYKSIKQLKMKTKTQSKKVSVVEALVNACQAQEKTISKLLGVIGTSGNTAVEYVKKKYAERQTKNAITAEEELKTNNDYFLDSLRKIGRPATSWEISNVLKKANPHFKKLSKNKKGFMQLVYSSASLLSKDGTIKRIPLGEGSYEYALHDFNAPAASQEKKKENNGQFLIEVLQQIGHPVTTSEIANRLRKINPHFKKLSKNKKSFMQLIYSNASLLSKEGLIERKAISGKSYEYFVKEKQAA